MRIHVSTRGIPLTNDLRAHVERRAHFALGRFAGRISRVRVRIEDENGPRGGVDTRCRILVHLPGRPPVVVEETATDAIPAIDLAAERTGRAVARTLARILNRRPRSRAA